jgi:hypothetical protein
VLPVSIAAHRLRSDLKRATNAYPVNVVWQPWIGLDVAVSKSSNHRMLTFPQTKRIVFHRVISSRSGDGPI